MTATETTTVAAATTAAAAASLPPLSREAILGACDLPRREVPVPEWGGTVWVRVLAAEERVAFTSLPDDIPLDQAMAMMVAGAAVDAEGRRMFTEADIPALRQKSFEALKRVFDAAVEFNVLSRKSLEAAEKNSVATPNA